MIRIGLVDMARPVQSDRNHRHAGADREIKAASLERPEFSRAAPAAFRKQNHGTSGAYLRRRLLEALERFARTSPVDGNVSGAAQVPSEKGQQEEFALGEKTELHGQVDKEDRDVHGARMIGAEDNRFAARHVFEPLYPHADSTRL